MNPQEIAESQLFISKMQMWITGLAIFLGPLAGVLFTLWSQKRKERTDAKRNLYLTLMGERKNLKISTTVAQALNTIDVVFSDNNKVKELWHKYYSLLAQPPGEERVHTWLELLKAMSENLRYSTLSQTDIDKFYLPQGHVDDLEFQQKAAAQWVRVLENTERFLVEPRVTPKGINLTKG